MTFPIKKTTGSPTQARVDDRTQNEPAKLETTPGEKHWTAGAAAKTQLAAIQKAAIKTMPDLSGFVGEVRDLGRSAVKYLSEATDQLNGWLAAKKSAAEKPAAEKPAAEKPTVSETLAPVAQTINHFAKLTLGTAALAVEGVVEGAGVLKDGVLEAGVQASKAMASKNMDPAEFDKRWAEVFGETKHRPKPTTERTQGHGAGVGTRDASADEAHYDSAARRLAETAAGLEHHSANFERCVDSAQQHDDVKKAVTDLGTWLEDAVRSSQSTLRAFDTLATEHGDQTWRGVRTMANNALYQASVAAKRLLDAGR